MIKVGGGDLQMMVLLKMNTATVMGIIIGSGDTQILLAVLNKLNFMLSQVVGTQKIQVLALTPGC